MKTKLEAENIMKNTRDTSTDIENTYNTNPTCPYCNYISIVKSVGLVDGQEFWLSCESCKKDFAVVPSVKYFNTFKERKL